MVNGKASGNVNTRSTKQQQQYGAVSLNEDSKHSSSTSTSASSLAASSLSSDVHVLMKQFADFEKRMLANINSLLESKLEASEKNITNMLVNKIDAVKSELLSITENIADLNARVNALESGTSTSDYCTSEIERFQRLNDIVIAGVPYVEDENPTVIYKSIAKCIMVTPSPYIHAFRVKQKKKADSSIASNSRSVYNGPIIVKLSCHAERNALFDALRKRKQPITLKELGCGFMSNNKIFINESLSPIDNVIKKKAILLRKQRKLHSVMVLKGAVYVKHSKDCRPLRIHNCEQLEILTDSKIGNKLDDEDQSSDSSSSTVVSVKNAAR